MTAVAYIVKACLELFLDDEFLAISVLVVVALSAVLALTIGANTIAGYFLVLGTIAALIASVWRSAR
jgi:hypothetical protein